MTPKITNHPSIPGPWRHPYPNNVNTPLSSFSSPFFLPSVSFLPLLLPLSLSISPSNSETWSIQSRLASYGATPALISCCHRSPLGFGRVSPPFLSHSVKGVTQICSLQSAFKGALLFCRFELNSKNCRLSVKWFPKQRSSVLSFWLDPLTCLFGF